MDKIVKNIILLRHEKRPDNPSFNTLLTEDGNKCCDSLVSRLEGIPFKPDYIYTSPYLRCLQTSYNISKKYDIKLNVDYSLSEYFNLTDREKVNTIPRKLTTIEKNRYCINLDYTSLLKLDNFKENELDDDLLLRTKNFIDFLIKNHNDDSNILIVGHLSVLNSICVNFGYNRSLEQHFNMGSIIKLSSLDEY